MTFGYNYNIGDNFIMLPDGLDGILRNEVEILLAPLSDNMSFCDLVKEVLNKTNPDLIKDTTRI